MGWGMARTCRVIWPTPRAQPSRSLIGAESLRVDVSRVGYWCLVFYPAAIIRATCLRVETSRLAAGELAKALGALVQTLVLHLVQAQCRSTYSALATTVFQRGALGRVSRFRNLSRVRVWGLERSM